MSDLDWLPPLVKLGDFGGGWDRYLEELYAIFCRDFKRSCPRFSGLDVRAKYHPNFRGKEDGFWHLITETEQSLEDRLPNLRRCETIRWPRAMIEAAAGEKTPWWRNHRGRHQRVVIALPDFSHVVVLDDRETHLLLWTQYPVEHANRRRDLKREWEAFRGRK